MSIFIGRPPDQAVEMPVDRCVAFAAALVEAFDIKDMDASPAIIDETYFLEFAGYQGDAAALHAQHLRKELLR